MNYHKYPFLAAVILAAAPTFYGGHMPTVLDLRSDEELMGAVASRFPEHPIGGLFDDLVGLVDVEFQRWIREDLPLEPFPEHVNHAFIAYSVLQLGASVEQTGTDAASYDAVIERGALMAKKVLGLALMNRAKDEE